MNVTKNYILICLVAFLATKAYGIEKSDSLYKILKIKTTGDYYVIHAQRNDSLFKIVSKKVLQDKEPNLELLRKGKSYYFDFSREDDDTTKAVEPLVGTANYLHVKKSYYWGDTKIKFTKRFHYRLYITKNLIGLYYSPS